LGRGKLSTHPQTFEAGFIKNLAKDFNGQDREVW